MTISSEVSTAGPYNGNGVTKIFPYGFRIVDETHIRVVLQDPFGDTTDLSLVGGDFTVSGVGNDDGGNVTVVVAPLVGYKLTLLRNPPFTQETDLANQGPYSAEVVEDRFDMVVMQIQAVNEKAARAITVAPGQTPPSADLIEAAQANAEAAAASAQSALESAALAGEFANNPEDVAVLPGLFSAFHWYRKTKAVADGILNTLAGWIHAATAKAPMDEADEFGFWDSVSNGLRKLTLPNLRVSIFKTTVTIANVIVQASTFRMKNAGGFSPVFDVTGLTADRTRTYFNGDLMESRWETISVTDFTGQTQVIQQNLGAFRNIRITLEMDPGASAAVSTQLSADNGGSWLAGAADYYSIGVYSTNAAASQASFSFTGSSFSWFAGNTLASGRPSIGSMTFGQFNKAKEKQANGTQSWITAAGVYLTAAPSFNYTQSTAMNALRVAFSVASSGRLIIEGIKG